MGNQALHRSHCYLKLFKPRGFSSTSKVVIFSDFPLSLSGNNNNFFGILPSTVAMSCYRLLFCLKHNKAVDNVVGRTASN